MNPIAQTRGAATAALTVPPHSLSALSGAFDGDGDGGIVL